MLGGAQRWPVPDRPPRCPDRADLDAARDDPAVARRAHLESTLACWMLGDHRGLADHAEQASSVDERFAAPALRAQVDFRLGIAAIMAGDPHAAADLFRPAVAAAEDVGFARVLVACSGVLAAALVLDGDPVGGQRELGRARAIARDVEGSRAMLLVDWAAGILAVEGAGPGEPDAKEVVPVGWQHFPPFAVLAVRHAHRRGDTEALRRLHGTVGGGDGPYAAAVARLAAGLAAQLEGARRPTRS